MTEKKGNKISRKGRTTTDIKAAHIAAMNRAKADYWRTIRELREEEE